MTFRVFNSMIGPKSRFQEAIKLRRSYISGLGDPPVVVALDDDPDALEYIFNVLHHRQERLPEVDQPLMVAVAAICDKYELHSALQPVADRVFLPLGEIASEGYGDWLFIAYVFGYEDLFSKVSQEVILSNQETISTISVYTPQKVTEMLIAKRTLIVSQLVERLISIGYERMIKPGEPRPTVKCKATYSGDTMCEFLQFGHFVGTLASGRLLENIPNKSLLQIWQDFEAIQPVTLPQIRTNLHAGSCSWVPEFKSFMRTLIETDEDLKLSDFPSSKRDHK